MKHLFFLLLINVTFGYSQSGSVLYTTTLNFDNSSVNQIKNNLSFNNFESLYSMDKNFPVKEKSSVENSNDQINIGITDSLGNQYYRNLKSLKVIVRETLIDNLNLKFYIYEDDGAVSHSWDLLDEFKNISGYNCQKAITNFRGRDYEAWFTSKIPLPYGPWKLGGLPGLILEAYDLTKEVSFVAEKIQIPDPNASKKIYKPENGIKIQHKEFVSSSKNDTDEITKAIMARMPKGTVLESVETKKNAVELSYSWEK